MIKLLLFLMFGVSLTFGQTYRNQYASKIHLTSDPTSGFEYVIVAPTGLATSYTFSLPPSIGNAGEVLTSLGNGSYTWTNPSLTSATPGGANTNIQFSLSNAFAGSNNFTWNNSTNKMYVNTTSGNFDINVKNWAGAGVDGKSGTLRLHTGHASGYAFTFRPNSAMTTSATFTLPSTYGTSGQFLVTDGAGNLYWTSAAVGGNFNCTGQGTGGGSGNSANVDDAFVGGGTGNSVTDGAEQSFIGGGSSNEISNDSEESAIITGTSNVISGDFYHSVIVGGSNNSITGESNNSTIGAGRYNTININEDDDDGESFIGAGEYNYIKSIRSAIPAGYSNTISIDAEYNIIGSGENNFTQYGESNGIVTGKNNQIYGTSGNNANYSVISGGLYNLIKEDYGFIGGGSYNSVISTYSSVGGGSQNYVSGQYSAVLGGYSNTVTGDYSMAFGYQSQATADYTIALGRRAVSDNQGAVIFADNTDAELNSSANNRMEMRFTGGYRFYTNTGLTTGMTLDPGANSWAAVSDRNLKNNIIKLDYNNVLDKIEDLEIFSWVYDFIEDKTKRNYSPMAQDFYKLFGNDELGHFGSDTEIISDHIMNIGLASLKGLVQKYEKSNERLSNLEAEQSEILNELYQLEAEIQSIQNRLGGTK